MSRIIKNINIKKPIENKCFKNLKKSKKAKKYKLESGYNFPPTICILHNARPMSFFKDMEENIPSTLYLIHGQDFSG